MTKDYPEVMTPEQVAEYLQLHSNTVYALLRHGMLKGIKIGRMWRIHKDMVDRFVKGESDNPGTVAPWVQKQGRK